MIFGPGAGDQESATRAEASGGVEAKTSLVPPTSIIPAMNPVAPIATTGLQLATR
jgi:hypothetical protein